MCVVYRLLSELHEISVCPSRLRRIRAVERRYSRLNLQCVHLSKGATAGRLFLILRNEPVRLTNLHLVVFSSKGVTLKGSGVVNRTPTYTAVVRSFCCILQREDPDPACGATIITRLCCCNLSAACSHLTPSPDTK